MTVEARPAVGLARQRVDAVEKVTGAARYTMDLAMPGMLQAKVLRSPHAHALVEDIDVSRARALPGVVDVVTRNDLTGLEPTYGYFLKDQPVLALDRVRYVGDMVAAVAAEDEATAARALELIDVTYAPLPAVMSIEAALADGAPVLFAEPQPGNVPTYGEGAAAEKYPEPNICYRFSYRTGDPSVFDRCDHVFEDEFRFSRMQHFHLEPFVSVARMDGELIEVWSSTQNPFPVRREIARVFNHPEHLVRVHAGYLGGAFGAKHMCKTEPIAILLAKRTRRPVRFCLSMPESFLTQSQHAAKITLRTGVMNDGTLVARHCRVLLDAGAYSDASPLVSEKAGYRAPGPYRWQHVDTEAACVLTNTTPAGPFRGFGAPQATWASESQVDMIARRLGLDPYELRMANAIDLGAPYMPGESPLDTDIRAGLEVVADELGYQERPRRFGRGMGMSVGFKDAGGVNKPAQARVKVMTSGRVLLQCGTVELGQGIRSALNQVVAEVLSVPADWVRYADVDTDAVPFDQGTNASSGVTVMGKAVELAARDARRQIVEFAAETLACRPDEVELRDWVAICRGQEHPLPPLITSVYGGTGFEFVGTGYTKARNDHRAPLETPCVFWEVGWGGADVEVDVETGKVHLRRLVVGGDAGRMINPELCRGQDEGAAMMAIGQALFEHMVYVDDRLATSDALTYRLPMTTDLPERFELMTQEQGYGPGPFGSKGFGEGGMLVVASAVANAVADAVGVRITDLPITPQKVLAALQEAAAASADGTLPQHPSA